MCNKCIELKEKFINAGSISERQTAYNEFDKQRNKCAKEQGKPIVTPKPEIKKEKKSKTKKAEPESKPEPVSKPEPEKKPKKVKKEKEKIVLGQGTIDTGEIKVSGKITPNDSSIPVVATCKYNYRGGLCANSQVDKPFCPGIDKCPLKPKVE